jgi:hypothetical protein
LVAYRSELFTTTKERMCSSAAVRFKYGYATRIQPTEYFTFSEHAPRISHLRMECYAINMFFITRLNVHCSTSIFVISDRSGQLFLLAKRMLIFESYRRGVENLERKIKIVKCQLFALTERTLEYYKTEIMLLIIYSNTIS